MRESAIKTGRLAEFDAAWQAAGITKGSSDDEVQAALDAIEPPFDPQETSCSATTSTTEVSSRSNWRKPTDSATTTTSGSSGSTSSTDSVRSPETSGQPSPSATSSSVSTTSTTSSKPDSGGPLDERELAALLDAVTKSEARAVVNGWLRQGNAAGCSWDPRTHPDVRHFEITRAALALAVAVDPGEIDTTGMTPDEIEEAIAKRKRDRDEAALTVMKIATGTWFVSPPGACLSFLTIDEAKQVTAIAEAFGITLGLRYTDDGQPVIEGDVAGVLERAA